MLTRAFSSHRQGEETKGEEGLYQESAEEQTHSPHQLLTAAPLEPRRQPQEEEEEAAALEAEKPPPPAHVTGHARCGTVALSPLLNHHPLV